MLSHYAVHTPLQARPDLKATYELKAAALYGKDPAPGRPERNAFTKVRQDHPTYAAMVDSVDRSVGRILHALDTMRLAERTVVVFVSDNGGLSTLPSSRANAPTANLPLRASKGWLYEGGIRVPAIIRGPGVKTPGRVIDAPAITNDLCPPLSKWGQTRLGVRASASRV